MPAGVEAGPERSGLSTVAASRNVLFCGLAVTGFANGVSETVRNGIERDGFFLALFNTFGISVIIWAAGIAAAVVLFRAKPQDAGPMDIVVAAFAAVCFLMPVPILSWLGITAIAAWLGLSPQSSKAFRRAGAILLALSVPMLWARILFAMASTTILEIDAKLVSWIVGTQSTGNTVPLADGSGIIFLEPGCSSITNVSLAILCGVLFVNVQGHEWSRAAIVATIAACLATVLINVGRISLIGVLPQYYFEIHGTVGATLAAWVTIITMMGIFTYGIRANVQVSH